MGDNNHYGTMNNYNNITKKKKSKKKNKKNMRIRREQNMNLSGKVTSKLLTNLENATAFQKNILFCPEHLRGKKQLHPRNNFMCAYHHFLA